MIDPLVPCPFKVFDTQPHLPVSVVEFASAAARVPFWLEASKTFPDQTEIRPVTSLVRSSIRSEFNRAARNSLFYDFGQIPYLVILFGAPHVERPIVNCVQRRLQYC